MTETLHLKPQPQRLTRTEIALDRLERHSLFVTERRRRGIEQASDEAERERLADRLIRYDEQIAREFDDIFARIHARARHLKDVQAKGGTGRHQVERKRKRSQPNFPMR
jgi:hypothetical protein